MVDRNNVGHRVRIGHVLVSSILRIGVVLHSIDEISGMYTSRALRILSPVKLIEHPVATNQ